MWFCSSQQFVAVVAAHVVVDVCLHCFLFRFESGWFRMGVENLKNLLSAAFFFALTVPPCRLSVF